MFRYQLFKSLRMLHRIRNQDPIDEEYRGWNWDRPPLRPRAFLSLGVSEIAYRYCPTRRDFYLRRVLGLKGVLSEPMVNGTKVHEVFRAAAEDVRKGFALGKRSWEIYEELSKNAVEKLKGIGVDINTKSWLLDLYKKLILSWCADEWYTMFAEYVVDGYQLGLSRRLRVDGLAEGGVIMEVKYGKPLSFHKLALAGYALALESNIETPFDYGLLVYISSRDGIKIDWRPIYISTTLRKEFIDSRDELIDMIVDDIEPPKANSCPATCPFRDVCK